jgi:hypothetical protein
MTVRPIDPNVCRVLIDNEPCASQPMWGWQRWATEEEVVYYKSTGDLPQYETTALLIMVSCDDHKLSSDHMAQNHDSTCAGPPTCDCSVSGA